MLTKTQFRQLLRRLHRQYWVVYAKPAFGGPVKVLRYRPHREVKISISHPRICRNQCDAFSVPSAVADRSALRRNLPIRYRDGTDNVGKTDIRIPLLCVVESQA